MAFLLWHIMKCNNTTLPNGFEKDDCSDLALVIGCNTMQWFLAVQSSSASTLRLLAANMPEPTTMLLATNSPSQPKPYLGVAKASCSLFTGKHMQHMKGAHTASVFQLAKEIPSSSSKQLPSSAANYIRSDVLHPQIKQGTSTKVP
jgi:hypothetical protein